MGKQERQLDSSLDQPKIGSGSYERGIERISKIASVLGGIDTVEEVTIIPEGSREKSLGRDLEIQLDKFNLRKLLGKQPSFKTVWVKAKPDQKRIDQSKARLGNTPNEIANKLAEDRLVLINASNSPSDIKVEFLVQLTQIGNHRVNK